MSWLILIFIAYLLLAGFIGYKLGFSKMLVSALAVVASILLTWALTPAVKGLVANGTTLDETMSEKMGEVFLKDLETDGDVDALLETIPLPNAWKDYAKEQVTAREPGMTEKQALAGLLGDVVLTALVAVVLFIVFMILITLLGKLLDLINRIPGFKQINGILGAVIALAVAILLLDVFFLFMILFSGTEFGQYVLGEIQKSVILKWLYDNNILIYLFNLVKTKLFG
ncbi:MAG: CvpA family protein [Lachnospiraceae bacterium]|nr:CvpA family protein [Lachnospiraceae bacterium]